MDQFAGGEAAPGAATTWPTAAPHSALPGTNEGIGSRIPVICDRITAVTAITRLRTSTSPARGSGTGTSAIVKWRAVSSPSTWHASRTSRCTAGMAGTTVGDIGQLLALVALDGAAPEGDTGARPRGPPPDRAQIQYRMVGFFMMRK